MSRFQPGADWQSGVSPALSWAPSATRDTLRLRAWLNRLIREFFHQRGVLFAQDGVPFADADGFSDFQGVDPLSAR